MKIFSKEGLLKNSKFNHASDFVLKSFLGRDKNFSVANIVITSPRKRMLSNCNIQIKCRNTSAKFVRNGKLAYLKDKVVKYLL